MNTQTLKRKRRTAKFVTVLLTAALLGSVFAINLSATAAAPAAIDVSYECESGIPAANHIEAGHAKSSTTINLNEVNSSDTAKATVSYTPGTSLNNLTVHGVSAGVAVVSYGTKQGVVNTVRYQITDSNNVNAYTIKDGGEVYFTGPGASKTSPVFVTEGDFNRIAWRSMSTDVAGVDLNGLVTANGKGVTIVIGCFTDKWGVPRDLHLLVGVGVKLSDSDLGHLIDLIQKGEEILANDPAQYMTDSLHDLQDAVSGGKDVINSSDPGGSDVKNAITDLENAINGMDKKPARTENVLGPDKDGNYYKPVGDPANVFEAVDEDGNSKLPPEYIYNPDGDPVNKPDKNRPSYPINGSYYVEDPEGSNIYKAVCGSGTLKDKTAIWGGPDGMLGGGDDESVKKYGNDYWIHIGQNIWQKVDKNKPTQMDPTLIGGGPDDDPATDPVTPIYKHGDKFFVGPLPPGSANGYYYGDKQMNGDGKVNSSKDVMHPTDDKYYLVDGRMVPESQLPGIPGLEDAKNGDSITIDGLEWTKVGTDSTGKYAMLILNDLIGPMIYDDNVGFNSEYTSASIRTAVDTWYKGLDSPMLKKFVQPAMIGSGDYQTWPYAGSGAGTEIYAFIPKKSDISTLPAAKRGLGFEYWTATKTKSGDYVGFQTTVTADGEWSLKPVIQPEYIRPGIWVKIK